MTVLDENAPWSPRSSAQRRRPPMPTDVLSRMISREQLDRYRYPGMHFSDKGGLEVTVARGMFEHLLAIAEAHLDEPARLAAARQDGRQEGYREGVEACAVWLETQAAAFLDARDQHMRACEATKGGSLAEEMHSRRACSAEATAASLSEAAAGLRRLCPPSAKPDAAVAEVGSDK